MTNKLELAQDKFIASIGNLAASFGLNQFIAQLYAVLYLSDKPLSLDELVERLHASKGNISINIRELEKWGAVRNVWVKGSRKDYYEADLDIRKVVAHKLKSGFHKRLAEVSDMIVQFNEIIQSSKGELSKEELAMTEVYENRLKKIEELKEFAASALKLADKFL